jgi:hypothetical protein
MIDGFGTTYLNGCFLFVYSIFLSNILSNLL